MNKYISLIKATMSEGMNIFRVNTKKKNGISKMLLPIFLAFVLMGMMFFYSKEVFDVLEPVDLGYVVLTIFLILTAFLTLIEGIYKSGNLLFNCKDDNLLLSLPIKKGVVLFIRIFKFYVFELMYNSIFLLPSIVVYALNTNVSFTFYLVSIIGLLLFPIIPILLSCIIGSIIMVLSSRFKKRTYVQTILTILFLLGVMYFSYNMNGFINNLADTATSINEIITRIYYPAGAYIELVTNFSALKLLEFIGIHVVLSIVTIFLISKVYLNINTQVKSIKVKKQRGNSEYKIKARKPIFALMKKEFSRFINSTVFVANAGFGLILFILGCIAITIKYDDLVQAIASSGASLDIIKQFIPIALFGFICFSSFMTSITSSMISLEGKSINVLKSLPIKPYTIVKAKVLTAVLIMVPCLLIGDLILIIKFGFDIVSTILVLLVTILAPLLAETIGIIVNLKYPKMDGNNDTETVKQSMSPAICVFLGLVFSGLIAFGMYKGLAAQVNSNLIMGLFLFGFAVIYGLLLIYLNKTCDKNFNNIQI